MKQILEALRKCSISEGRRTFADLSIPDRQRLVEELLNQEAFSEIADEFRHRSLSLLAEGAVARSQSRSSPDTQTTYTAIGRAMAEVAVDYIAGLVDACIEEYADELIDPTGPSDADYELGCAHRAAVAEWRAA